MAAREVGGCRGCLLDPSLARGPGHAAGRQQVGCSRSAPRAGQAVPAAGDPLERALCGRMGCRLALSEGPKRPGGVAILVPISWEVRE
eukprot:7417602-Alexandrium_andersonii.AAC.1